MAMARTVDSSLFDPAVPVIIQGITGRAGRTHAQLMRAYGTTSSAASQRRRRRRRADRRHPGLWHRAREAVCAPARARA